MEKTKWTLNAMQDRYKSITGQVGAEAKMIRYFLGKGCYNLINQSMNKLANDEDSNAYMEELEIPNQKRKIQNKRPCY
jgi:uncharacterized membrane protein YheB (UPF0754 family)